MKRIFALVLALLMLLTCACSGGGLTLLENTEGTGTGAETEDTKETVPVRSVLSPLSERPNYTLHEGATADEMRQTAIRAMRDSLTVTWYPEKEAKYEYTSPNTGETIEFHLYPNRTYAGIPYSSSYTGLFQFLEFYDFETGRISVPSAEYYTSVIGADCAGGILWGIAACVPSFEPTSDGYARRSPNMVAVGPYTLPSVNEEKSSEKICKMNGEQVMYESYACLKPADTVSTGGNAGVAGHYMMLLEEANVVRLADGTIDGKKSTVTIQDQMRGHRSTSPTYVKEEDGEVRNYSGKWGTVYSFEYLWTNFYLPVTCKEFLGESPYVMPWVALDREASSGDELAEAHLTSQYMLCAFHVRLVDESGSVVYSRSKATNYSDLTAGNLKNYPLKTLNVNGAMLSRLTKLKGAFTLEVDCVDATGTLFNVARVPVTLS